MDKEDKILGDVWQISAEGGMFPQNTDRHCRHEEIEPLRPKGIDVILRENGNREAL